MGGNVWASEPSKQHFSSSEKTAARRQEGKSGYTQVCNKEGNLNIKDQIADKGISHSMYGRMQASGLTEFTPSTCTSAVWGQILFLVHLKEWQMAASRIPPAPQQKCSWLGTEQD